MRALHDAALALSFLSVLPVPRAEATPQALARSTVFFPLVGLVLGAMLVGARHVGLAIFPAGVVDLFLVLILVGLTRGLHLDGLADSADALGSGAPRNRALEIMKDPRIGSFGMLALAGALLAKFQLIAAVGPAAKEAVLLLFPLLARWSVVPVLALVPYARAEGGLGGPFSEGTTWRQAVTASVIMAAALAAAVAVVGWQLLVALLAAVLVSLGWVQYVRRRLGGVTGDTLGAQIELVELGVLASLVAVVP